MEIYHDDSDRVRGGWNGFQRKTRVLLREPEVCQGCGRIFISLYPLKACVDHEGLEEL